MAKTRGAQDIDERQQNAIIEGRKQGRTHEELTQQFGISKSTVIKLLKRWKVQRDYVKKKKTEQPRSCTSSVIDRNILSNPLFTADIAKEILISGESGPTIWTICYRLQVTGLHGQRPEKKPFISTKNRKVRVE